MKISLDLLVDDETLPLVVEEVQAQHLQPWMLYLADDTEVFIVGADPDPFVAEPEGERPQRWVNVTLLGAVDVMPLPATSRVHVIYGEDPEQLQEMLPEDLLDAEEEALSRNGMCSERADEDGAEEPIWCGQPSDPTSFARLCAPHDEVAREQSDHLTRRGYAATYAAVAELI